MRSWIARWVVKPVKSDYIILTMDQIPSGTAQMKRYDGRTKHYFKSARLQQTEDFYMQELGMHAPTHPYKGAISLSVDFDYYTPTKKRRGTWKTSRPDVDNVVKLLIDCMTKLGFWEDDSQIARLRVSKRYSETDMAKITISWREAVDE